MRATPFHHGAHCKEADIYPAGPLCPVCMNESIRDPVYQIQDAPKIMMLECRHCGACSASFMPKDSLLDDYYSRYYSGSLKTTTSNANRFARHVTRRMRSINGSAVLRILDFGGGDGSLAQAIARDLLGRFNGNKAEIDLVDYEAPGAFHDGRIDMRGHRDLTSVSGPYNIVIASAILEHIPHLYPVICRLMDTLAPGAYFYARTPFILPLARLIPNLDITYPAHVHDLGNSFWNRFAQSFHFDATMLLSQPSIVETAFWEAPLRTTAAFMLKLPCHLELALRGRSQTDPFWKLVGGWEVLMHFAGGRSG